MNDIRRKYVSPALDQLSFNCPHCGALANQHWFSTHAEPLKQGDIPHVWHKEDFDKRKFEEIPDSATRNELIADLRRYAEGYPCLSASRQYVDYTVMNVSISECFSCKRIALWRYDQLLWPRGGTAPLPNPDLPPEIRTDYEEASAILDLSPRGAAALLRLAVQRICKHLGLPGTNISDDIGALVKQGLDTKIQRALDIVRVIGNNAVHPGQIDLRDDRATADYLFVLVNLIADRLISEPKNIDQMYEKLPEGARTAVERRDGK